MQVSVITTNHDGVRIHIIVAHSVAQTTKQLIAFTKQIAARDGLGPVTLDVERATWLSKAKFICCSGRELVSECAWHGYKVQENILL